MQLQLYFYNQDFELSEVHIEKLIEHNNHKLLVVEVEEVEVEVHDILHYMHFLHYFYMQLLRKFRVFHIV
jgi:hypothetical protein